MILIFLKIFVEGFLGNSVFREQVLEIQFCFKVGSSSLIQSLNQLLNHHSVTRLFIHPPLIYPSHSFQRRHQRYVCGPCSPPVFLLAWSTLQRLPPPLFSLCLGLCHARARAGLCHLLATGEAQSLCSALSPGA